MRSPRIDDAVQMMDKMDKYISGDDDEDDEMLEELELEGLDYDELSFMDEAERREALEDAGLDADDYDF